MSFSAQGSITVRRLRTGVTITLYFVSNGKALQQFVNTESGSVYPDWSITDNQPEITPQATASSGTVTLSNGTWKYNGIEIEFSGDAGTTSDGYVISDNFGGAFALNTDTFAIRIIDNLASKENYASDTLELTILCTHEGNESLMTRSTEITILQSGTSTYTGYLATGTNVLTADVTSTNIYAQLSDGSGLATDFYTKWYKNYVSDSTQFGEMVQAEGEVATITVNREQVNGGDNNDPENPTGGTLFICQFYLSADDSSPVATAGISIADEADEYSVVMSITSENKEIAEDKNVTVTAQIYSLTANTTIEGIDPDWTLTLLMADLTENRSVKTNSVDVTMEDSEKAGGDVNVVADVTFSV